MAVLGVAQALANLARVAGAVERAGRKGVNISALNIEAQAKNNAPIDSGNLKASGFTLRKGRSLNKSFKFRDYKMVKSGRDSKGKFQKSKRVKVDVKKLQKSTDETVKDTQGHIDSLFGPAAAVGFGANYALPVHEIHPGKSKFLERAIRETKNKNKKVMRDTFNKEVKKAVFASAGLSSLLKVKKGV